MSWMRKSMSNRKLSPDDLPRLRRAAYEFLRRYAATAWEHFSADPAGGGHLSPEVEGLPEGRRFRTHSRQEARRLAGARLFDLCPEITDRAVLLGAAIRENRHEEVVALAGRPNAVETLGI